MSRLKKIVLSALIGVFAFVLGLFSVACDTDEFAGFKLDKTSITVRVGDEPEIVKVLNGDEEYLGVVAWATLDNQFLSVSQGHVTGVSKGEGEVTATVYVGEKTHTLRCKVTVDAAMYVQTNDLYSYAGTGDIEVSVGQNQISSGTNLDKVSVKRSLDGEEVQGLLYSVGEGKRAQYFLKNTAANPLSAGVYYICYDYSMEGVSRQSVRKVTVRGADRYEDLFLLSAINGTEYITGRAANSTYVESVVEKENPGEFFVYADGVSVEKGMNESKEEFMNSLALSEYNGLLNENVLGHDTVYRMYTEKGNAGDPPYPYYFVNLFDSANPVYNNLSELPETATIDVWARLWYKELGSDEYTTISGGSAAIYKNMNSGTTRIKSVAGAYNPAGGWTKYVIPVSQIEQGLAGASNIAVKIDRGGVGLIGSFYLELYSVELTLGSDLTAPFGEADLTLAGAYTGLIDDYIWEIRKGDEVIKSSTDEGQIGSFVTNIPAGEYTVRYTVPSKNWTVEKSILSGVLNGFTSVADLGAGGWHGDSTPSLVELSERGIPTPQSAGYEGPLSKTTALEVTAASDGQSSPYIPLVGLYDKINDYDSESAHIELWVYFDAQTSFTITSLTLYAAEGTSWSSNTAVDTGAGVSSFVAAIGSNKWERVRIMLSDIRNSMQEGETYNGLGFYFRPGTNGIAQSIYYYSAEIKEFIVPSGQDLFTDTLKLSPTAWGTQSVLSLVDTPQNIGVPQGKTDAGRMLSYTTDNANQTMFELRSTWYRVEDLLGLNDEDIVGLWVYIDGDVTISSHTLWVGFERDWNKRSDTFLTQSNIVAKQWSRWDFKVSELRQAYASLQQNATTNNWNPTRATMMLKLAANGAYTAYFHSVEIIKAN